MTRTRKQLCRRGTTCKSLRSGDSSVICLFWSNPPNAAETLAQWTSKRGSLNPFHILPLLSHAKLGNRVHLYTYHAGFEQDVPASIAVLDAGEHLPARTAFEAQKRGHSIAHVSDYCRLASMLKHDGVFMDMDAVALRRLPQVDGFVGTHPAKKTGGMVPRWGEKNPALAVPDGSWDGRALIMPPFKSCDIAREPIEGILAKLDAAFERPGPIKWNDAVMFPIKEMLPKMSTSFQVYEPLHFCAVPNWKSAGNCYSLTAPTPFTGTNRKFGHTLPSADEIFRKAYAVQHFMDSECKVAKVHPSGGGGGFWKETDFWKDKVEEGSLVAQEAIRIVGENWRGSFSAWAASQAGGGGSRS